MSTMTVQQMDTMLTGHYVKLYPYIRGSWPPETLFNLWRLMSDQGALPKVFWGRVGGDSSMAPSPYSTRGDLVDFIKFYEPEPPGKRFLLMAQSQDNPQDIAGMVWFDDYVPNHRAAAGVFYRRKYWGEASREGSRLAQRWAFTVLDLKAIWAYTPWRTGVHHAQGVGMTLLSTVPEYLILEERYVDLNILRITREEYLEQGFEL